MFEVESLEGKTLDLAADIFSQQIKYVYEQLSAFASQDDSSSSSPQNLELLLEQVVKIRSNVRLLLTCTDFRLQGVESALRSKLVTVRAS